MVARRKLLADKLNDVSRKANDRGDKAYRPANKNNGGREVQNVENNHKPSQQRQGRHDGRNGTDLLFHKTTTLLF